MPLSGGLGSVPFFLMEPLQKPPNSASNWLHLRLLLAVNMGLVALGKGTCLLLFLLSENRVLGLQDQSYCVVRWIVWIGEEIRAGRILRRLENGVGRRSRPRRRNWRESLEISF